MRTAIRALAVSFSAAVIAIGAGAPNARALDDFHLTETSSLAVGASPEITVATVIGDVTCRGSKTTTATITLTITVHARNEEEARAIRDEIEIQVKGGAGKLRAEVKRPDRFERLLRRKFGRSRSIRVDMEITLPTGARGSISSLSGTVRASDLHGPLAISTVSGNVVVRNAGRLVQARTVSGDATLEFCADGVKVQTVSGGVRVVGVNGSLFCETVSGEIGAWDVTGHVTATSISGDIKLQEIEGDMAIETTSGDVHVEHRTGNTDINTISGDVVARTEAPEGETVIHTTSGSVELSVHPEDVGEVSLSTFSGEIDLQADVRVREHSRNGLRGRMSDGDGRVEIRTQSGDISLESI